MHMMSASLLTVIIVHGTPGGHDHIPDTSKGGTLPVTYLFAVAFLFAFALVLATAAFMYLSVPVVQMLRAGGPAATYCMGLVFGKESLSLKPACQVALLTLGVLIAAYDDFNANAVGVIMQIAAIFGDATRFVLMQMISQGEHGVSLTPIGSLYYVAPLAGLILILPAALMDGQKLASRSIPWFWLFASCCTASLLNLLVFTLVGKTSALTANITGPLRDVVAIVFSMYLFGTSIRLRQWIGYSVAVACIFWYHRSKSSSA
jgi:drug/metabolite transporter (DMT)-like permease